MVMKTRQTLRQWNVVVTTRGGGGSDLLREIGTCGDLQATAYENVHVAAVPDVPALLARLGEHTRADPGALDFDVARIAPAEEAFSFGAVEEFEVEARRLAVSWAPRIAGRSFHVRLHRRGLSGRLCAWEEERYLENSVLAALSRAGTPAALCNGDPDVVLCVDTVDRRAGMALWTREDLARWPFLRPEG
jgi:hypothetical protein